ncbi:MAG: hypothetical protein Q9220_000280 [cf. Caloplaca sp. 1 TL-2023]
MSSPPKRPSSPPLPDDLPAIKRLRQGVLLPPPQPSSSIGIPLRSSPPRLMDVASSSNQASASPSSAPGTQPDNQSSPQTPTSPPPDLYALSSTSSPPSSPPGLVYAQDSEEIRMEAAEHLVRARQALHDNIRNSGYARYFIPRTPPSQRTVGVEDVGEPLVPLSVTEQEEEREVERHVCQQEERQSHPSEQTKESDATVQQEERSSQASEQTEESHGTFQQLVAPLPPPSPPSPPPPPAPPAPLAAVEIKIALPPQQTQPGKNDNNDSIQTREPQSPRPSHASLPTRPVAPQHHGLQTWEILSRERWNKGSMRKIGVAKRGMSGYVEGSGKQWEKEQEKGEGEAGKKQRRAGDDDDGQVRNEEIRIDKGKGKEKEREEVGGGEEERATGGGDDGIRNEETRVDKDKGKEKERE